MIIKYIKRKSKTLKEIIENIFYYNAKFNSTFPYLTISLTIILIILCSYPIILQIIHRINYLPEEQIQFLDTTYQPLNKVNKGSIEENINYNELLSIVRNVDKNTNKIETNIYGKDEIKKIKNKSIHELDTEKLGRFISIVEHITIDTNNINEEYQIGRGQGVINKDTILQAWRIQQLLETVDIEIPNQYFSFLNVKNNDTLYAGAGLGKIENDINLINNIKSSNDFKENSLKIDLKNSNVKRKRTFNLKDICIKDENQKCIIHSPLILWDYNITKLENDDNILDTITSFIQNNVNKTISFYSIFGGINFNSRGKLKSSNNLILTFFLESKNIPNTTLSSVKAWNLLYQFVLDHALAKEYKDINIKQYKISNISKELSYNVNL
ncbi:hypothetical protein H8356DRAFT_1396915 [Neocallimastix lanati (nom. inval.)]|nr:hypothetical protein H8356DRAFT_1396915 [Neocallimastix sp. JGI-2020a]